MYKKILPDGSTHHFDNYDKLIKIVRPKGGKRPNAGAPKKQHPAKVRTIRLTDAHWEKFHEIGGLWWLRQTLDTIKEIK